MNFVYPNFLWALFFIAVPIIIHLFYFRRFKKVYFSNTSFLNEIKDESSSKNKLKHLLILFARIFSIIFLVFAFSQPFFKSAKNQKVGERFISLYLDNSFSMKAEGNGKLLFDEGKEIGISLLNSFADDDKIQIISNDFEGKHQRFVNKTEAKSFFKNLDISSAIRDSKTVFERQKNSFPSTSTENIVYQISDFQKNNNLLLNDSNYTINIVKLSSSDKRNIYIDTAWFDNSFQLKGTTNKMIVRFRNESKDKFSGNYQLILNDNVKSVGEYIILQNSFVYDTVIFKVSETGWNTGKIQISDYPITFDDTYYFSFYVEDKVNVLSINDSEQNIFNAVFKGIESVNFNFVNYKKLDYNNLNKYHFIILNDIKSIPTGLSQNIKTFVENGGSLFIVPNKQISIESYNVLLSSLEIGIFTSRNNTEKKINKLNLKHYLLEDLFEKKPVNINLPIIKRSYILHSNKNSIDENILSYNNGDPFLVSNRYKNGNVYLQNSSLDKTDCDFKSNAIFAPIVYKMSVLGVSNISLSFEINGNTIVKLKDKPKKFEDIIKIKNNDIEIIPHKSIFGGFLNLNILKTNLQDGIYTVFTDDKKYLSKVAMNYSRKESSLDYYSIQELEEKYFEENINIFYGNSVNIKNSIQNLNHGKTLWKRFIIFSLLFLALEIFLLRLLK